MNAEAAGTLGTGPRPSGNLPLGDSKLWTARPICLRLLTHWARRAASRAACTAGSSRPMRTAMMAMTTSNSISVNPLRCATAFQDSDKMKNLDEEEARRDMRDMDEKPIL